MANNDTAMQVLLPEAVSPAMVLSNAKPWEVVALSIMCTSNDPIASFTKSCGRTIFTTPTTLKQ